MSTVSLDPDVLETLRVMSTKDDDLLVQMTEMFRTQARSLAASIDIGSALDDVARIRGAARALAHLAGGIGAAALEEAALQLTETENSLQISWLLGAIECEIERVDGALRSISQ